MKIVFIGMFILMNTVTCQADRVCLKNRGVMEGIIKDESEREVTLDVGFGTVTIAKDEIERIERDTAEGQKKILKGWQEKYPQTGRWVPKDGEPLFNSLKKVLQKRESVMDAMRRKENIGNEIAGLERNLSELYANFAELNERLKQTKKIEDTFTYNKLVAEINTLSLEIKKRTGESKTLSERKRELDAEFSNCMTDYISGLSSFTKYFNDEYARLKKEGMAEEDDSFYRWVLAEIDKCSNDLERKEAAFSRDKAGMLVSAVLNGKVTASLVVDTGASLVTISRRTAEALGIYSEKDNRRIELVLADGSRANAISAVLDSVDVDGFEVKNVMAAIIEEPPDTGVDGLLGMSFLSNFLVRLDANNNRLVLEKWAHDK